MGPFNSLLHDFLCGQHGGKHTEDETGQLLPLTETILDWIGQTCAAQPCGVVHEANSDANLATLSPNLATFQLQ